MPTLSKDFKARKFADRIQNTLEKLSLDFVMNFVVLGLSKTKLRANLGFFVVNNNSKKNGPKKDGGRALES